MDIFIKLLEIFISWPVAVVILALMFKAPLRVFVEQFLQSSNAKLKVGSVEVELGNLVAENKEVLSGINELHLLIAKSRLIELQFAQRNMAHGFRGEELPDLREIIKQLEHKLSSNKKN
jgi:hypothetical protein